MPSQRGRIIWIGVVFLVALAATAASGETTLGRTILTAVQRFMLFYAGVFALIALTATVGIGLAATDRIVMVPSTRVVAQAVHRAMSMAALAFLVIHIVTEILAHRSDAVDAFIPFLARGRTFYIGLGTIASDLLVILIVTGLARSRFAGNRPRLWRAIHASAYLCFILSILHGLLGGRTAKPYVDWSYGACVAAVLLALAIRLVATVRDRRETVAQPVPSHASSPVPAAMSALAPLGLQGGRAAVPRAGTLPRALPAGAPQPSPDQASYPERPWRGSYPYAEQGGAGEPYTGYPASAAGPAPYSQGPSAGVLPSRNSYPEEPATGAPNRSPWAGQRAARAPRALPPGAPPSQPPHTGQPPYAGEPYSREPYSGKPSSGGSYPGEPYGAGSYPGEPYSGQAYPGQPYPGQAYASQPYPSQPYPRNPARMPLAEPFAENPYSDDPYQELGEGYDFPQTGPELWPDHPSAPMPVYPPPERGRP